MVRALRRLFETLDPTLRRAMLPSGQEVILSDTVGFISDLPHQLVKAFQARASPPRVLQFCKLIVAGHWKYDSALYIQGYTCSD